MHGSSSPISQQEALDTLTHRVSPALEQLCKEISTLADQESSFDSPLQIAKAANSLLKTLLEENENNSLETVIENLRKNGKTNGLAFEFHSFGPTPNWPSTAENEFSSFLQEAYQNTLKYARASHLRALRVTTNESVTITLSDDGQGTQSATKSLGLSTLQAWTQQWDGSATTQTTPGGGFTIIIALPNPLPQSDKEENAIPKHHKLGRQLHDQLCQYLTALTLIIETLRDSTPNDKASLWQKLRELTNESKNLTQEVRTLSHQLCENMN